MADEVSGKDRETAVFVLHDDRENAAEKQKIIKVQFNPSSLNFSMGAAKKTDSRGDIGYSSDGQKKYADYNTVSRKGLSLDMELIFDGTGQKKPDVYEKANEFMDIIKNPYIRNVDFYWGKMQYFGIVENVETEFTYFTAAAAPVRAKVNLSIAITEDISIMGTGKNE